MLSSLYTRIYADRLSCYDTVVVVVVVVVVV